MKIILRQNFEKLGQIGDVVHVKDGYARNFLIPRKIAYTALEGGRETRCRTRKGIGYYSRSGRRGRQDLRIRHYPDDRRRIKRKGLRDR